MAYDNARPVLVTTYHVRSMMRIRLPPPWRKAIHPSPLTDRKGRHSIESLIETGISSIVGQSELQPLSLPQDQCEDDCPLGTPVERIPDETDLVGETPASPSCLDRSGKGSVSVALITSGMGAPEEGLPPFQAGYASVMQWLAFQPSKLTTRVRPPSLAQHQEKRAPVTTRWL